MVYMKSRSEYIIKKHYMQIYKITNLINGRIYIGKDKHNDDKYYGSGKLIKQSIKKYGKNYFKKEIIQECFSMQDMEYKEKYWIKELNSHITKGGYNLTWGGEGGDTTSQNPNKKEIIEKRRKANVGKKRTYEQCENIKNGIKKTIKNLDPIIKKEAIKKAKITKEKRIKESGYTNKEIDGRKIIVKKLIEYNKSKKGRERVSKQWKGKKKKPFTIEHRKNIGNASKGRISTQRKKVIIEGIIYEHMHEAAKKLNIHLMTLRNRLLNKKFENWNYV